VTCRATASFCNFASANVMASPESTLAAPGEARDAADTVFALRVLP
jgi:hypothetical protein